MGYPKISKDNPRKARSRASVDMQLRAFKNIMRGTANRIIDHEQWSRSFLPSRVMYERFTGIGIKGKHPAPSFKAQLTDELSNAIVGRLIVLGHKLSKANLCKYKQGMLALDHVKAIPQGESWMGL